MTGFFISFEGGEGAGKTTQIRLLAEYLRAKGRTVLTTREPGGSSGAEEIRALLVNGEVGKWDGLTEALLLCAARRDHYIKIIAPALARGETVVCDRFFDSTLAYQGYGHGLSIKLLKSLHYHALGVVMPDLTVILDIDPVQGLERAVDKQRYEMMDVEFHHRLRNGFRQIAAQSPSRCVLISAEGAIADVQAGIIAAVEAKWP